MATNDEAVSDASPVPVPAPVPKTDAVIDQWFMENFHNTVGWDTATYNRFYTAKEELKTRILNAVKEG